MFDAGRAKSIIQWCSYDCAVALAEVRLARRRAKDAAKARVELRKAKSDAKTRREWITLAQAAVNAYCRARDLAAGHPCICCGKPFEPQRPGGSVDAGHFLSRGSHPNLRFNELNIHAQRKNCNRPGGTTAAAFRLGMIVRIGLEEVEKLESDHTPAKHTIADLVEIRDHYRKLTAALKRAAPEFERYAPTQ